MEKKMQRGRRPEPPDGEKLLEDVTKQVVVELDCSTPEPEGISPDKLAETDDDEPPVGGPHE